MSEHDKLHAVREKSQAIGEFLDWLDEKGIRLARYHEHADGCYEPHVHDYGCSDSCGARKNDGKHSHPFAGCSLRCEKETNRICGWRDDALAPIHTSIEKLLAEYFEIDLDKLEREKRAMLAELRKAHP